MDYTLEKLLDLPKLQDLLNSLNEIHSLPTAIFDMEGSVLTATVWQDICAGFHRSNAETEKICREHSRHVPANSDERGSPLLCNCPFGLQHAVTPITINDKTLGYVLTGQLFTTPPEESFFIQQAQRYGFDTDQYLAAMRKVPLVNEAQLHKYLDFIGKLAGMLASQGLQSLRQLEAQKALQISEERHKTILQPPLSGICLIDRQGRLLEVNRAYCQKTGYSEQELLTMSVQDLEVSETAADIATRMRKIHEIGEDQFESRHRRKDGSMIDVEISIQYRPDNGGQYIAFLRDITERKLVETYRNMRQEIMSTLSEPGHMETAIQHIITLVRSTTGVEAVGIRLQDGDDYPYFYQEGFPQEFLQKENSLLARTRDGGICRDEYGNIRLECTCGLIITGKTDPTIPYFTSGGSCWTSDAQSIPDGPTFQDLRTNPRDECLHLGFASVALIPIRAKGKNVGLLQLNDHRQGCFTLQVIETLEGIAENIGEAMLRKQAEEKLVVSERFLRMLTDQLPGIISYWDSEMHCRFANKAYQEWFGRTSVEMMGISARDLLGEELFRLNEPFLREALQGNPQQFERTLVKRDGEIRHTWAHYIPDMIDGKTRGIFVLVSDITELKQAEAEKAKLEAQLQQAQKLESIGRLAGGVAHDFNNMLSVILGHVELVLMRMDPNEPLISSIKEISKAAERSTDLTRQMLAFARKQAVSPRIVNLNEAVAGMLNMLQRLIGENIKLAWQPATALWQVMMDTSQIDQIMANLCVNARDAIADTGSIVIATENCCVDEQRGAQHNVSPGCYVKIAVSDNGSGMDRETLEHIFEPFFTTKRVGEGTGLGLSTVYGIVTQNNGFIDVTSSPGKGTTFTIYLPQFEGDEELPTDEALTAAMQRGHETVLLVEDEPAILEVTAMILSRLGYKLMQASSPGEALSMAQQHKGEIHLLVTDVIMPDMNGRELADILAAHYPQMKCLFMSGYTADIIANHGVLDEGVHFVQKPFQVNLLAAKLREVLDS